NHRFGPLLPQTYRATRKRKRLVVVDQPQHNREGISTEEATKEYRHYTPKGDRPKKEEASTRGFHDDGRGGISAIRKRIVVGSHTTISRVYVEKTTCALVRHRD